MDNKSIIIIILIVIAIAIASFGGYFTLVNNEKTRTMAFEEFTIEVPENVEFQTSLNDIHMINSSEGYFVAELGRNSSVSEKMFKNIASKNQDIGNIDGFNVENASGLHVYKTTMGNTKYVATYNLNGVSIIIGAPDLDHLKRMVNSIKFTNITVEVNNNGDDSSSSQPTVHVVKKSSSDSNTSKEEENPITDEDLANAYTDGYTNGYNDGNYYSYEYSDDYSYSDSSSGSSSSSESSSSEVESTQ